MLLSEITVVSLTGTRHRGVYQIIGKENVGNLMLVDEFDYVLREIATINNMDLLE